MAFAWVRARGWARPLDAGRNTMAHNPHDALFKHAFSQEVHAAGELRSVLPAALADRMDFGTLRLRSGSFVDEALQDRHSDLLYSVELAERAAFVYVLFEHQSTVDPLMAYRVLRYMCRIWERWLRDHEGARWLPAVIPVVLHHSESGWTASRRMLDLLDVDAVTLGLVQPHVPAFELLLDDLSTKSDEELFDRAMTAYARLVLWCLRSARGGRLRPGTFALWARAFREVAEAPNGREALETIFLYLVEVLDEGAEHIIEAFLAEEIGNVAKETYVTLQEKFLREGREEGRAEGREEGRAKGREEGRVEGERALLLKQLELKFGPPSSETQQRVQEASVIDLERWAERILTASRLEEVWG